VQTHHFIDDAIAPTIQFRNHHYPDVDLDSTTFSVLLPVVKRLHVVRLEVLARVAVRRLRFLALNYNNRTWTRVFYNARDRARTAAAR
jgi:hypothetical protein